MVFYFPRYNKFQFKDRSEESVNRINKRHVGLNQYPVFQVPEPLRDVVRFRITRAYGRVAACNKFYKDFFKCAYEVGKQLEFKECWKEYADMKECEGRQKTKSRMIAINKKRHKDGKDFLEQPPRFLFDKPYQTFRRDTKL